MCELATPRVYVFSVNVGLLSCLPVVCWKRLAPLLPGLPTRRNGSRTRGLPGQRPVSMPPTHPRAKGLTLPGCQSIHVGPFANNRRVHVKNLNTGRFHV